MFVPAPGQAVTAAPLMLGSVFRQICVVPRFASMSVVPQVTSAEEAMPLATA